MFEVRSESLEMAQVDGQDARGAAPAGGLQMKHQSEHLTASPIQLRGSLTVSLTVVRQQRFNSLDLILADDGANALSNVVELGWLQPSHSPSHA